MKKIAFITLGCKVNQYETNAMMQQFMEKGDTIVKHTEFADVYIINTCTVTNVSDRKSRQMLRKVKELNSKAIVVAVGCYAQVGKEELEKIDEIDVVLGNNEKKEIVKYVEKYVEDNELILEITNVMKKEEFVDFGSVTHTEKTRAVVKVQDGCDRFCTYCIIPFARGNIKSRKKESILDEITKISKNGIKEIVITGIHIASYGKETKDEYYLVDLLEDINKIEGIQRIRLGSLEPMLLTNEFIKRISKLEKVCQHFHISIQSGSNATLERMNRRYKAEELLEIAKNLRETYQDVLLTTDIIVGFPGETEEEFAETVKFLEEIKLYKIHVFKYSPRKGTKAAVMENQIDNSIKEVRSKKLIEMSEKNQKEYNELMEDIQIEVLIEDNKNGYWQGHAKNFTLVKIKDSGVDLENKIITGKCVDTDIENITIEQV